MARTAKKARIEEEQTQEDFLVEYFKKVKVDKNGKWRYLVKWFGYDDPKDDSWEPMKNIANCQRLLASFWEEIGVDDGDYYPGWESIPSDKWIKKERAYFAANHKDRHRQRRIENQKLREAEEERQREERKRKKGQKKYSVAKSTVVLKPPRPLTSTTKKQEESDDPKVASSSTISKKRDRTIVKKEKKVMSDSSDSDVPLAKELKGGKMKKSASAAEESSSDSDRPLMDRKRKRSHKKQGNKLPPPLFLPDEEEASASDFVVLPLKQESVEEGLVSPVIQKKVEQKDISLTPGLTSISSNAGPLSAVPPSQVETSHVKQRPSLPRPQPVQSESNALRSSSSLPGQSSAARSTSTPTLPKLKAPNLLLQTPSPLIKPLEVIPSPVSTGGGISTKQRLSQGALQITVPTAKFPEGSRPLPPQKSNSLAGLNIRKNTAVKVSPTIAAADKKWKVPAYSPQDVSFSSTSTPTSDTALRRLSNEVGLGPSLSKKRNGNQGIQISPMPDSRSSSMHGTPTPTVSPIVMSTRSSFADEQDMDISPAPELPPPVSSSSSSSSRLNDEADNFLKSIFIQVGAAPKPSMESPQMIPTVFSSNRETFSKDQAIWTGEFLICTSEGSEPQTICKEGMLMPSDPFGRLTLQREGMPLKVAISYNNSSKLSMESFYSVGMLDSILAAFKPVQEWGWLHAGKKEEISRLSRVAEFLYGRKLVGSVPIIIEGNVVALLVLYPSTLLHGRLPRAPVSSNGVTLNVALYSYILGPNDRSRERARKPYGDRLDEAWTRRDFRLPPLMYDVYGEPRIKPMDKIQGFKVVPKHAVRMLELPELLHSFLLGDGKRPFALWPPSDSEAFRASKVPYIEMEMLSSMLKEYPNSVSRGIVGTEQDSSLKIIFIHVNSLGAALGNVGDMPGLAKYRSLNDVKFFVYGSSDVVNPRFPNLMEEIWHIGGIVTFTPHAILSDFLAIKQRIRQVEEHNFWGCYILPAVIGMALSIAYRGKEHILQNRIACTAAEHPLHQSESKSDAMDVDDQHVCDKEFVHEWLLEAVEEELISIVGAPPFSASDPHPGGPGAVVHKGIVRDAKPRRRDEWKKLSEDLASTSSALSLPLSPCSPIQNPLSPSFQEHRYKDEFCSWVHALFDSDIRSRSETLAYCLEEFQRVTANVPSEEWEEVIRKEVIVEMDRWQVSRRFREEFRRFVIVAGKEDNYLGSDEGGFEWVTAETFRFNDDTDLDEL